MFDDGSITFKLSDGRALNEIEGIDHFGGFVGIPGEEEWTPVDKSCYSYDDGAKTIKLDGSKYAALYDNQDAPGQLGIQIVGYGDADETIIKVIGNKFVDFRYSFIDYGLPEDRTILPGWDGFIEGESNVYMENTANPEGYDERFQINNIEVTSGKNYLETFEPDDDGWYYRAGQNTGTVTFKVTYTDLDGAKQSSTWTLTIANDIYECSIWSDGNIDRVLPGGSINLNAWGTHRYRNGETQEGLVFEWLLEETEDASLTVDPDDPTKAVLTFRSLGEEEQEMHNNVPVTLQIKDKDGNVLAEEGREFSVESEFVMIYPTELDHNLQLGQEIKDQEIELRHYKYGGTPEDGFNEEFYRTISFSTARWLYDENEISIKNDEGNEITDNNDFTDGNTFTFKRIASNDFRIAFKADYTIGDRSDSAWQEYYFNYLDYNIWFESGWERVYDDSECTVALNTNTRIDGDVIKIEYTAEGSRWNEEADTEEGVEVPNDCWQKNDDFSVTVFGDKMRENKIDNIRISANLLINGEPTEYWCECWFNLDESCTSRGEDHLWASLPADYADCTSKGTQKQICYNCGEKRTVEVDARGHIAKKVAAKASTASAEGNIEYYECSECNRLFSDSNCTNEITQDSTIVPKGTTLSKLTAASKGFTAKWNVPDGSYLDHTTGYEIMYALNSKFTTGNKTVSISNNYTASKKISKLKAKKKYYVKIRTYRTIDGKKYYSPWSKVKTIKTK